MRLPGRAELADGLVGGSLSFVGGVVAGTVAYIASLRAYGVDYWTAALGFGAVLAVFGFLAEFVRCWIAGPRFGAVVASVRRAVAPQPGAARGNRAQRMLLAGLTAIGVLLVIWGLQSLAAG